MDNMDFLDDLDEDSYRCRPVSRNEMVELAFETIIHETRKAWCVRFPMKKDLTNDEAWLPKSQCDLEEGADRVWVPRWLVTEKELENYEV
jgi:hypothetical protein